MNKFTGDFLLRLFVEEVKVVDDFLRLDIVLQLAEFSNYGNAVEISAPGDALICKFWNADDHLLNGTYATYLSGTSFSAPIVAGYACIRQSIVPMEALGLTKQFIKDSSSLNSTVYPSSSIPSPLPERKQADYNYKNQYN